jgi:hypothetical protein
MTAPAGIFASPVTGGGDWTTARLLGSFFCSSGVTGRGDSVVEGKRGLLLEGVRRCRVRYDAERGNSDLLTTLRPSGCVAWIDDRRLELGDVFAEAAGDRWEGGV